MKREIIAKINGNYFWDFQLESDRLNALAKRLNYDVWFGILDTPGRGYSIQVGCNDLTQLALFNIQTGTISK